MAIFRLVIFSDGGQIYLDKNPAVIPTFVLNELIVKQFIDQSRIANQAQIRLGKSSEFTARISRRPESGINVALLFAVSLRIPDPEQIVEDVAKIWVSGVDEEKREALIDLRVKTVTNKSKVARGADSQLESKKITDVKANNDVDDATKEISAGSQRDKKDTKGAPVVPEKSARKPRKLRSRKKKRTWDGGASDSDSDTVLDYSDQKGTTASEAPVETLNALDLGSKSSGGFVVKELKDELSAILKNDNEPQSEQFGFFKKFVGGKKLGDDDLREVLAAMEDHLVGKNVAKEVAAALCSTVSRDLLGTSTRNWTSVKQTVRASMQRALQQILTPATSTDLLAAIHQNVAKSSGKPGHRPYVISVVGVNGVGKSTNLGKLAFWFLQNDFKVLVAACDTFRSGAVEQLKVHVQRLRQSKGSSGEIDLFDQGYGKDAALIARRAVEHATKTGYDVVLIDTAGRRHNDDRLMSSLEKFGDQASPDKIIMVGEALVGTDSVDQARNFDAAFGKSRGLDFFLISKCDTVGNMLGTLVNVTYATGVPVLFVGVGQQYTDLRTLSVEWAVTNLLS